MGKDFFDEDLVSSGNAFDAASEPEEEKIEEPAKKDRWNTEGPYLPVSDLNLSRLAREKRQLDGHVAGAIHEIEQLERRQSELEQRKKSLEELALKQDEYERGKKEIIEKIDRSIILMEKDELQAAKTVDVLQEMRGTFRETLAEIKAIDEESWPSDNFEEDLDRAVARVENATMVYSKGINRIEAIAGKKGDWIKRQAVVAGDLSGPLPVSHGFGYWLKAGFAFSLPLLIVISALFAVYLFLMGIF